MPDIVLGDTHHSSRVILCLADGCNAKLWLQQAITEGWGLTGGHVDFALSSAAACLGWSRTHCPKHAPGTTDFGEDAT